MVHAGAAPFRPHFTPPAPQHVVELINLTAPTLVAHYAPLMWTEGRCGGHSADCACPHGPWTTVRAPLGAMCDACVSKSAGRNRRQCKPGGIAGTGVEDNGESFFGCVFAHFVCVSGNAIRCTGAGDDACAGILRLAFPRLGPLGTLTLVVLP